MAKVDMNAITQHFRGRVGDVVFRRVRGRLFAIMRPKPFTGPPSAGQLEARVRFQKALIWAQAAITNPATQMIYQAAAQEAQQSMMTTAVTDYFRPPIVSDIDLVDYKGHVGEKIKVLAKDDVKVVSVHVLIKDPAGATVEQGMAVFDGGYWVYTTTAALPAGQPATVVAMATDIPGNTGAKEAPYAP